jgi:hypothetical protein
MISLTAQPDYGKVSASSYTTSSLRKIIIFEDTVLWRHYLIREHNFIRYRMVDSKEILKGRIKKIHHDTLVMEHGFLLTGNIDRLVSSHSRIPRYYVSRSRIYIIPDSAIHSPESKLAWKHWILKPIRQRRALSRTDTIHNNFIKLNLSRLFGLEIALSYERKISPSVSMEAEVGYGFPIYDRSEPGSGSLFEFFPHPEKGFSILIGPKIYRLCKIPAGFYVEPLFLFRDLSYINVYHNSNIFVVDQVPVSEEFYPFGDIYTLVYGVSFRVGIVRKYRKVIMDYYMGIGIKDRDITYHYYGYYDHYDNKTVYYHADHLPVIQKTAQFLPIFNLGVKIGFGF